MQGSAHRYRGPPFLAERARRCRSVTLFVRVKRRGAAKRHGSAWRRQRRCEASSSTGAIGKTAVSGATDTFDRAWRHLSDLDARRKTVSTISGSAYRLQVGPDRRVTLRPLRQGRTHRTYSEGDLRRLWALRDDLGDPAELRPSEIERLWGTGRHGSYLWLIYREMWDCVAR